MKFLKTKKRSQQPEMDADSFYEGKFYNYSFNFRKRKLKFMSLDRSILDDSILSLLRLFRI